MINKLNTVFDIKAMSDKFDEIGWGRHLHDLVEPSMREAIKENMLGYTFTKTSNDRFYEGTRHVSFKRMESRDRAVITHAATCVACGESKGCGEAYLRPAEKDDDEKPGRGNRLSFTDAFGHELLSINLSTEDLEALANMILDHTFNGPAGVVKKDETQEEVLEEEGR